MSAQQTRKNRALYKQRGAGFVGWMAVLGLLIFVLVTVARLAPVYMEFYTVKSLVERVAAGELLTIRGTQQMRTDIAQQLGLNSLYTVKPEYFSVVKLPQQQDARALKVEYEVRKPWLANIDFMMSFKHVAVLKRQN